MTPEPQKVVRGAATADGCLKGEQPALVARTFWAALSEAFLMPAIYLAPLPPEEAIATKQEVIAMLLARHGARVG